MIRIILVPFCLIKVYRYDDQVRGNQPSLGFREDSLNNFPSGLVQFNIPEFRREEFVLTTLTTGKVILELKMVLPWQEHNHLYYLIQPRAFF